jgi:hypothetical protein
MRVGTLVLSVVLVAGLASPAYAAPPPSDRVPAAGWSLDGAHLVWRADEPVPVGDSAVEFWDGDRLLGRPTPSADHRTFKLPAAAVRDPAALAVRVGSRRLDVDVPPRTTRVQPTSPPAVLPAGEVDPGKPGPFATRTGEYTLDSVRLPGYPAAVEMAAIVVAPVGAPGKRPLALFLHGRHWTCYEPGVPENFTLEWPCTAGMKPVPSHRGYLQAQELLASQGYVTVSISANGVNGQDADLFDSGAQGRSSLVRRHLAKWAAWARGDSGPAIVKATPTDLSKVLLVGHSRGGEGVNRAALDTFNPPPEGSGYDGPVRWNIRGTLLIGPTIFGLNPAPEVPSITILPGCDGDVSDLQGEQYLDATRGIVRGTALHSALYFFGANHNYFNTEWTPGQSEAPSFDDVVDPEHAVCGPDKPGRLTPEQQQTAGATYIAAAARLFVAGDERVLPLVDGSGVRAPSAGPVRVLSHAVGAARTPFVVPDATTTASGGARMCLLVTQDTDRGCMPPESAMFQPHVSTLWGVWNDPDRFGVALSGAPGVVRPAKPVSLAGSRELALRIIAPTNTTDNRFDIAITDTRGRTARLGSTTLDGLPAGDGYIAALWAQEVRVPLPANGIDLRNIASLEVAGNREAWLIDAYGWRGGLPPAKPVELPRIDVGELSVEEGDAGVKHYEIPVTMHGDQPGTMRLFVGQEDSSFTTRLVHVRPGHQTIELPYDVVGNTVWGLGSARPVYAKAIRGVVSGGYVGGLLVFDDDPQPTITITSDAGAVAEGGALTWTATLSAPAEIPLTWTVFPADPAQEPALSTTDVDPDWFRNNTMFPEDPLPSRPLAHTSLLLSLEVPAGELTGSVTVPTVTDGEVEPTEHVQLYFTIWPPIVEDQWAVGAVTDAP